MSKMVRALTVNLGTPFNTEVNAKSAFSYLGHMIYATTPTMIDECCFCVNQINDQYEGSAIFTQEDKDNARLEAYAFFGFKQEDMFNEMIDDELLSLEGETFEIMEEQPKKKRVKQVKSPLFEMLPQVFKGNGKVKRHPINDKIKTSRAREIMRLSIRYASMSSVMVVLPCGVLSLSDNFKTACVNSVGESIYDFVLEEMMMQGWTLRGIEISKNEDGNNSFSMINSENA